MQPRRSEYLPRKVADGVRAHLSICSICSICTSACNTLYLTAMLKSSGGAGGLVVLAGFKPVAGRREAAWVGSIPTRLRQKDWS